MSEPQKVRVVVWTPCSVIAALGCGGLLAMVLLGMCVAAVTETPAKPAPPAAHRSSSR